MAPFLLLYGLAVLLMRIYVRMRIYMKWPPNKYILFVYTQSEHWSPYIEQKILPSISDHAVVINRTTQQQWKKEFALEKRAIELWADIEANPIALVFKPYKKVKAFRFYEAFRDFKHGKESKLNTLCQEFYDYASLSAT
ncbi:MAG: hypothetical protein AB7U82_34665 [Blastocatellales bacterium]